MSFESKSHIQTGLRNKRKYEETLNKIIQKTKHFKTTDHVVLNSLNQSLQSDYRLNNKCQMYDSKDQAYTAFIINAVKCIHNDIVNLFLQEGRKFEYSQLQIIYSTLISIACISSTNVSINENALLLIGWALGIAHIELISTNTLSELCRLYTKLADAYTARFSKLSMPRRFGKTAILGAIAAAVQYRLSPKDLLLVAHVKAIVESGVKSSYEQNLIKIEQLNYNVEPQFFFYRGGYFASHSTEFGFKWQENWSGYSIVAPNMDSEKDGKCLCAATSGKAMRGQDSSFVIFDEAAAANETAIGAAVPLASSQKCHIVFASTKSLKKSSAFWDKWSHLCKDQDNKKIFNTVETYLTCPYCINNETLYNVRFSHSISCPHYSHFVPPYTLADGDVMKVLNAVKDKLGQKELQGIGELDLKTANGDISKGKQLIKTSLNFKLLSNLMKKRIEIKDYHSIDSIYTYMDPSLSINHNMAITTIVVVSDIVGADIYNKTVDNPYLTRLKTNSFIVVGLDQIPLTQHDPDINAKCLYNHIQNIYKLYPNIEGKRHVVAMEGNAVEILPVNSYNIIHSVLATSNPAANILYYSRLKSVTFNALMKETVNQNKSACTHVFGETFNITSNYSVPNDSQLPVFTYNQLGNYKKHLKGFLIDENNKLAAFQTMTNLLCTCNLLFADKMQIEDVYNTEDLPYRCNGNIEENNNIYSVEEIERAVKISQQRSKLGKLTDSLPKYNEDLTIHKIEADTNNEEQGKTANRVRQGTKEFMLSNEDIQLEDLKNVLEYNEYSNFINIPLLTKTNNMLTKLYEQLMKTTIIQKQKGARVVRSLHTPRPDDLMISLMCNVYMAYYSLYNCQMLQSILLDIKN